MSLELHKTTPAPATVYATVKLASDLTVFNGSGLETWDDANIATYAVFLGNMGGDDFAADFPAELGAGRYYVSYYRQGGGAPATDDLRLPGEDVIDWRGTGVDTLADYEPTDAEWELRLGPDNTAVWTDLNNERDADHIQSEKNIVRRSGRARLRGMIDQPREGSDGVWRKPVKPWELDAEASETFWIVLTFYFAGYALKLRLDQNTPTGEQNAGDLMLAHGDALLNQFIGAGLEGLTLEETEVEESTAGTWNSVPITWGNDETCDEFSSCN